MPKERSAHNLKYHLMITVVLVAVNIVFLAEAVSEHSTALVLFWSILAIVMIGHALSLVAGLRHQS